jgi:mannose-6-phosphate isomerase-like protein (cupin superfamily)
MQIRRVASGQDAGGKAHVVSDVLVQSVGVDGVIDLALLWSGDAPPSFPLSGEAPACPSYFPPLGGYRFFIMAVPPETEVASARASLGADGLAAGMANIESKFGTGLAAVMEPDHPGMHTTDTIDFEIVLEGEVWLELDDGEEVHLKAGDTFVQNGTRHRWFNRGRQTAKVAAVLIGGRPRSASA